VLARASTGCGGSLRSPCSPDRAPVARTWSMTRLILRTTGAARLARAAWRAPGAARAARTQACPSWSESLCAQKAEAVRRADGARSGRAAARRRKRDGKAPRVAAAVVLPCRADARVRGAA
jgi:hypothetical protein